MLLRTATAQPRQDVSEAESERLLELLERARGRITVGPPAVELRRVPEPFTFHVVIADLHHALRSQRHERQILTRVPARALVPPARAVGGHVRGPIPRMLLERGDKRL